MDHNHKAFTLIELLLSVAIVALLVTIVVASMRGVRATATRAGSMSALRQMSLGFASYSTDHRQQLMPGYIDENLFAAGFPFEQLVVELPDGGQLAAADSQSYVWRLSPYLNNAWETFFEDASDPGVIAQCQNEYGGGIYGPASSGSSFDGGIAERPTYGMNSIFIGGDSRHGGPTATSRHPWQDTNENIIAATRLSQVRNTSRVILFAPTAKAAATASGGESPYEDPGVGFCELQPPYLPSDDPASDEYEGPQWGIGLKGRLEKGNAADFTAGAGLLIDRTGSDRVPVVHLDGSSVVDQITLFSRDMVRWNPFELVSPHRVWDGSPNRP